MFSQTLDDSDIERLGDHFEVKDMTLGHLVSIDFHIAFDWPCLGHLPSLLELLDFISVIHTTLNGLRIYIVTSLLGH